jgi:bifunctional non-homologous end joining protein LigD
MRLRLIKKPFDHPDYLFELKHDGFRTIAYIDSGDCRLVSRNLKALPFKSQRASLTAITVANAILDGEIVVLDYSGVSQFNALLSRKGKEVAVFYAFDLIWMNGTDLRELPLVERKKRLCELCVQVGVNGCYTLSTLTVRGSISSKKFAFAIRKELWRSGS